MPRTAPPAVPPFQYSPPKTAGPNCATATKEMMPISISAALYDIRRAYRYPRRMTASIEARVAASRYP